MNAINKRYITPNTHLIKRTLNFIPFRSILSFDAKKDYYKILNTPSTSTAKDIKNAFYKLAKQYHPDINKGKEDKFKEINEAYETLGDDSKRKSYDEMRKATASSSSASYGSNTNGQQAHASGYHNYGAYNNYNRNNTNGNRKSSTNAGSTGSSGSSSEQSQNTYNNYDYNYTNRSSSTGKNPYEQYKEQEYQQFYEEEQLKRYMNNKYAERTRKDSWDNDDSYTNNTKQNRSYYNNGGHDNINNFSEMQGETYKKYMKYKEDEYRKIKENEMLRKKSEVDLIDF